MKVFLAYLVLVGFNLCSTIGEDADDWSVTLLTEDTFADVLKEKPYFVKFFAPWCGHCKKLAPVWQELFETVGGYSNSKEGIAEPNVELNVGIARVDCTKETALCSKQQVTGYPTLKFFKQSVEGVKYKGGRALDDLLTFIKRELGLIQEVEVEEQNERQLHPIQYTSKTFDERIKSGHHFVKFYAPWCAHCKKLAPIWTELAKSFGPADQITIAKVDCTREGDRDLCNARGVRGYPTLLWFTDGQQVGDRYAGDRTVEALRTFALEQASKKQATTPPSDEKSEPVDSESTPSPPPSQSAVLSLGKDTFEDTVARGVTIVKFFAPWCGHCKRMAGAYEALGQQFSGHAVVRVAEVDCTVQDNRELCARQEVKGFPTVHVYRAGERKATYSGNRSTDDMAAFVTGQLQHDEL